MAKKKFKAVEGKIRSRFNDLNCDLNSYGISFKVVEGSCSTKIADAIWREIVRDLGNILHFEMLKYAKRRS